MSLYVFFWQNRARLLNLRVRRHYLAQFEFLGFWHDQKLDLSTANYSPSVAMELKVGKEITCKLQNQRSETNKDVSRALYLKLQAAGISFEKLLGWTVFKNPNFNPSQFFFSFAHPWHLLFPLCYFIFPLMFKRLFLCFS